MCDFFQKAVGSVENGAYLLHQMKKVRVDKRGICWNKHKRLLKGSFQPPETMWTPQRCKELARETIQLVNCQVKCRINKVAFLAEDSKKAGTSLNWMTDLMMINPFNMLSPLDIISVVLHEMAHQLVRYGHQHAVRSVRWDHCEAWEDALWYFTLFMVSEYINPMNILCLMTLSLSLWYYLGIINIVILFCHWNMFSCFFFQGAPLHGFPLLSSVASEYGQEWVGRLVHGPTICHHCHAYHQWSSQRRLLLQNLQDEGKGYVTDAEMDQLVERIRAQLIKQQQQQQQVSRKRRRDGEEGKNKKPRRQ